MKVKNLFNVGIDDMLDPDLRMRITASNIVFLTISLILLITIGLNIKTYVTQGITSFRSSISLIIFSVSIGGILLNHKRRFLTARLVFFLSWTVLITAFPMWRTVTLYGYFLHPMFGIVSSTMVLLMFSFRKEKAFYLTFLTFSILITVFSFDFVSLFDEKQISDVILAHTTYFRLHMYPFFFTLFFNLVLMYIFRINGKFVDLQQQQHETIVNQNRQLSEARLTLELSNSELETRVHERTLVLQEQNARLKEYAFFHAHVLRAPVSRIRGLLNLMNLPIDQAEEKEIRDMLSQSVKELDDTIHMMNDKLHATNLSHSEIR